MSINLEVSGDIYEGFTSARIVKSIDRCSGSFQFVLTQPSNILTFPLQNGSPSKVLVNNIKVIDGFIQILNVDYNKDSHTINISGGDKTVDFIDSDLDINVEFNADITLKKVVEQTLRILGIDIEVIDNVGNIKPFEKSELVSGSVGENAFEFVEKYCRKRQVLLAVNNDGNIVLQRASTNLIPTKLLNEINGNNNNIIRGSVGYDDTQRFHKVSVRSQDNFSVALSGMSANKGINKVGIAYDTNIRESRSLTVIAENSSSTFTSSDRAVWEVNIRRSRGTIYSAIVQGFTYDGINLWSPNNLVHIVDKFADIDAQMLIQNVTFDLSNNGSFTTLDFLTKNAYTLEAEQNERSARSNNQGNNFNL